MEDNTTIVKNKTLIDAVKAVAVLVVITLVSAILLGVVNWLTWMPPQSIDIGELEKLHSGTWTQEAVVSEFADQSPMGIIKGQAKHADGSIGLFVNNLGGYKGANDAHTYVIFDSTGVITNLNPVRGEGDTQNESQTVYGGANGTANAALINYIKAQQFSITDYNTILAITADKNVSGATASASLNGLKNGLAAACKYMIDAEVLGKVSMPMDYFADYASEITGRDLTADDVSTAGVPMAKVAFGTTHTLFISETTAKDGFVLIYYKNGDKIEEIGVYNTEAKGEAAGFAAITLTEYKAIDFKDTAADMPIDQIGDGAGLTGLALDVYNAVKKLCAIESNPDAANDETKEHIIDKLELDDAAEILTIFSKDTPDLNLADITAGTHSEVVYAGVLVNGDYVFVVEIQAHGSYVPKSTFYIQLDSAFKFVAIKYTAIPATDGGSGTEEADTAAALTGLIGDPIADGTTIAISTAVTETQPTLREVFTSIKTFLDTGLEKVEEANEGHETEIKKAYADANIITLLGVVGTGSEVYIGEATSEPKADLVYVGLLDTGMMVFGVETKESGFAVATTIYVFIGADGKIAKVTYGSGGVPASDGDYPDQLTAYINGLVAKDVAGALATVQTGTTFTDTRPVLADVFKTIQGYLA